MRRFRQSSLAVLLALLASVAPVFAQPAGLVGPGGVFDSVVVPVAANNTIAATTLYSAVIPAGFGGGPRFSCIIKGRVITATNTTTGTLTVAYGGQTLTLISGSNITASTATQETFTFDLSANKNNAAGTSALLQGIGIIGSATATAAQVFTEGTAGTQTLASVAQRTFTVTWTWGAASGNTAITADNVICKVG